MQIKRNLIQCDAIDYDAIDKKKEIVYLTSMKSDKSESQDVAIKTMQITLRVPLEWVQRADAIARRLSRPGTTASRSIALREALLRGIEALEAEEKKAPRPPARR